MDIVLTALILLFTVALSGTVVRLLPFQIPMPLVQVAMGALLAWPTFGLHLSLDPDIFLLLFIPPLLFADGWRIPKRELFEQRRTVLALALGLVFFTVAGAGYFIHWLIPTMPLPIAFALAAVLSPTDAVALAGIVGRGKLPAQLMHVLEGEALLNDASGLVAFKFAVAAALTGSFSLWSATGGFLVIALGGLAVGIALSWAFNRVRGKLSVLAGEADPGAQILLILLLPFASYLLAEHLGFSGILAAVAAGMTMQWTADPLLDNAASRLHGINIWLMIEFAFNGIVFILLGLQFPGIIGRALMTAHLGGNGGALLLIGQALAVFGVLLALRMLWVWLLRWISSRRLLRHGLRGSVAGLRVAAVTSLAGVRGAITLAASLSLPLSMPDGTALPGRDQAIFIASAVILCSLLAATLGLPLLLRGNRDVGAAGQSNEERQARAAAAQAALVAIEQERERVLTELGDGAAQAELSTELAAQISAIYRRPILATSEEDELRERALHADTFTRRLHIAALYAEREELRRLHAANRINDELLLKLIRETDYAETAILSRGALLSG